jgi:hypothetical protein
MNMKPYDPNEHKGLTFGTDQLIGLLPRSFSQASTPEMDLQTKLLRQMSGYFDTENPHGAAHQYDPDSKENKDKRMMENSSRVAFNAARWANFSLIGPIGHSFQNLMGSLFSKAKETVFEKIDTQQQKAVIDENSDLTCSKNGRMFKTREEIEQYGLRHGFDKIENLVALEETMMVDGVRMHSETYQEYLDMQSTYESLPFYEEQVINGEIDPLDLPEDVKNLLADAQKEINPDVPFEEAIKMPPVEVEAQFQDVINVIPTLGFTPKP